jgi:PAS domain S-box-containing protein
MRDDEARGTRTDAGAADGEGTGTALREALRRRVADLVLETAAEGIWLIDADARTTFVNRRAAQLLGYTEDEMIGKHVFAFIDKDRWPAAGLNLKRREFGIEERLEVQLLRKDGTRVWTIGSATPIFDRDGTYQGTLAMFGDLTAQKQREQALRALVDSLRSRGRVDQERDRYREPFRSAVVLATCGSFVATVAILTVGAVLGSMFGIDVPPGAADV